MAGTCVLTFDDGPDEVWTPRVLAELDRCGLRATFFVVGQRVARLPDVVRAAIDRGHDVELHCHEHRRHSTLSPAGIERDTAAALNVLQRLGVTPSRWRTPWGVHTPATATVAKRHRLELVGWTIDTHDWRGDDTQTMLENARPSLHGDPVVLMHDSVGPGARRDQCAETVGLIAPLAEAADAEGLDIVPLSATAGRT
jgi:peptidoglycan/xylan/chitin deacetylase (PgdA/CDA1 family)